MPHANKLSSIHYSAIITLGLAAFCMTRQFGGTFVCLRGTDPEAGGHRGTREVVFWVDNSRSLQLSREDGGSRGSKGLLRRAAPSAPELQHTAAEGRRGGKLGPSLPAQPG